MALQSLADLTAPEIIISAGNTSLLIDASGEKVGCVFLAPKAGNISTLTFALGTVTTGQTIKASLQDVDATTGQPDGTIDQSGTVAVGGGDSNTSKTVTLGSSRAVSVNDRVAAVLEFDSTVGNLNILCSSSTEFGIPYVLHNTGSWTKQVGRSPILAIGYDDGSFEVIHGMLPGTVQFQSYNSGTAGADEYALIFQFPFPVRVAGAAFHGRLSGDADLVLYDSNGSTVLQSVSLDKDVTQSISTGPIQARFASAQSLAKATSYRLAVKPTTVTDVRLHYLDCPSAASLDQLPCKRNFHLSKRVDGGSWTEVTTQRPVISLFVEACDDASGGGASVIESSVVRAIKGGE
jgi:hypothetical protein